MTDESVQNQVSTTADGAQSAPAVAVEAGIVLAGGGQVSGAVTQGTGVAGWVESEASKVVTLTEGALTAIWGAPAHIEATVKTVADHISAGVSKVEGDVVADLKALVNHLHAKYDALVQRVIALEAHIEGRFGSI